MRDKTAADPLLLRYALALQAQRSDELPATVEQLRDRFAASRLRGDRVHLREEARFTLHLLNAPTAALTLAHPATVEQNMPNRSSGLWRSGCNPGILRVALPSTISNWQASAPAAPLHVTKPRLRDAPR